MRVQQNKSKVRFNIEEVRNNEVKVGVVLVVAGKEYELKYHPNMIAGDTFELDITFGLDLENGWKEI